MDCNPVTRILKDIEVLAINLSRDIVETYPFVLSLSKRTTRFDSAQRTVSFDDLSLS